MRGKAPVPAGVTEAAAERTLILVKPDAVARNLIGEVLGRVEAKGYR
ncbi:MAG TPA: hypothetical protein DCO65_03025, partial [Spartobacteria bacterium]|nr:hypothetical protein [Spartobacteria bacterium]